MAAGAVLAEEQRIRDVARHERAKEDAGQREQQALRELLAQVVHVQRHRVAEEQERQEREQQHVRVDVQPHRDRDRELVAAPVRLELRVAPPPHRFI